MSEANVQGGTANAGVPPVDKGAGVRPSGKRQRGGEPNPPLMKGVNASANRAAVHGPDGPSTRRGAREALCRLLDLKDPTDNQLFDDAAHEIMRLRRDLGNLAGER